jgi:hypothetical protein
MLPSRNPKHLPSETANVCLQKPQVVHVLPEARNSTLGVPEEVVHRVVQETPRPQSYC